MINKKIRDITLKDFANLSIYDEVNFDKERNSKELLKLLDRGNQILKESFVNQELNRINKDYRKVNTDYNLIITDYFKNDIDNILTIVASRTVEPGPEELTEKQQHWLFNLLLY